MQVDGIGHERLREKSTAAVSGEAARLLSEPVEPHQINASSTAARTRQPICVEIKKQRLLPNITDFFGHTIAVDLARAHG
jgi:hypothetical protein